MARKIIEIGGPGLGDSMSYTTLPEELTRQHGHEVWLRAPGHWNNPEIRMMWDRNPWVKGFCDEPQSDGFASLTGRAPRSWLSWTRAMEDMYGCEARNDWPRIYWTPEKRPGWAGKIFCDPRSSSQSFPAEVINTYVSKLGYQLHFDPADVVVVESPYSAAHGRDALPGNRRMTIDGLDDLASVITSSAIFLTVESGTQAFASAVKGGHPTPIVVSLFTDKQFNDGVFVFSNVIYKTTGFEHKDWHSY